jgi:hypothetical protein
MIFERQYFVGWFILVMIHAGWSKANAAEDGIGS